MHESNSKNMDNHKIAEIFQEMGDILEILGENRFRVLAYQKAARVIEDLPKDLRDIYQKDPRKLEALPGIGKDLASKIVELIKTGKCKAHEDMLKHFSKGLLDILRVRGIGPKKVKLFYAELQIDSIEKLKDAARAGMLKTLPGMGEKSEMEIIKALGEYDLHQERMLLSDAMAQATTLVEYVKKNKFVRRAQYAGSLRRMKDSIGDIDILSAAKNPSKEAKAIMDYFVKFEDVQSIIAKGETKTSVILKSGAQVDLRVVDEKVFGAALHYFTGSKAHNITIRDRAKKMGLKVNEYGVFKLGKDASGKDDKLIAGKTEEEVFKSVGLPYIAPELREDRGEIEAGLKNRLPEIIELKDLCGDLHLHSRWSDGKSEIEEIARAYYDAGFSYIAITDHSPSLGVAHGLTVERFKMQWDEIDEINSDFEKEFAKNGGGNHTKKGAAEGTKIGARSFKILKGVECDILADGSMDLPDSVLKKMDIVVASVHTRFNMDEDEMTKRVLKAIKNPYVKILGHASGRLINQREPYAIDMGEIIDAAIHHKVALEINSQPTRLDLYDYYCKMAKEKGAKFTINSDGHNIAWQINSLNYGISVARRGWLEKEDVLNCMPVTELFNYWKKK
jgi:DNA polymerase (family 10)